MIVGASNIVSGQKVKTKADVQAMFPAGTKDLWINFLSGTFDGLHVVDMIIGSDGKHCNGVYTIRNSNVSFFFQGDDVDKNLKLVEMNEQGRMTGYLYGTYDGTKFSGQWMNASKSHTLKMELHAVNTFNDFNANHCGYQQWHHISSGKVEDKDIRLSINRTDDIFQLALWQGGVLSRDAATASGGRVINLDLPFVHSVLANKIAVIDTANFNTIQIISLDENGYEVSTPLKMERKLMYDCYEYADYQNRLKCIRPLTGNKRFDTWIEDSFKNWITTSSKKIKSTKSTDIATKDRWNQVADGWVEIDLFLEDIISGTIYMQSSWSTVTEKIAFIFDLRTGRELQLNDIFDKNFDAEAYFQAHIPTKKNETQWKSECKKWVAKQTFQYATLTENGISFKTDFSTIYGEKEIIFPYSDVENNLKNKSLLKDIVGK